VGGGNVVVEDKDVSDQVIKPNHLSSAKRQPLMPVKTCYQEEK
jgi:hypothetical protein